MKQFILALIVIFLFACNDEAIKVPEGQITDLSEHNMKLIPENLTTGDEIKLVVFDDCTYNVLAGITKNDHTIDIQKQFNSMMKWPCFQTNDTILIGKLPEGSYTVNYKLLDVSTQVSNPIALSFSFNLLVSQ